MIYLAVPFSHPSSAVMKQRFKYVTRVAAKLLAQGHNVFSPITQCYLMAQEEDLPNTWEFWSEIDLFYLDLADYLYILPLPGWEESTGVEAEVARARQLNIPIRFVNLQGEVVGEYK